MKRATQEPYWADFVDRLGVFVDDFGSKPIWIRVWAAPWRVFLGDYRALRRLAVKKVELDQSTWEVCLHAPGLLRANEVAASGLTLAELHRELAEAREAAPHCRVVLSDQLRLTKEDLVELVGSKGGEWTGPGTHELDEDEGYVARFDVPLSTIVIHSLWPSRPIHLEVRE